MPGIPAQTYAAIAYMLLWVAAALTVYTGVIYFRNGMAHIRPGPSPTHAAAREGITSVDTALGFWKMGDSRTRR